MEPHIDRNKRKTGQRINEMSETTNNLKGGSRNSFHRRNYQGNFVNGSQNTELEVQNNPFLSFLTSAITNKIKDDNKKQSKPPDTKINS